MRPQLGRKPIPHLPHSGLLLALVLLLAVATVLSGSCYCERSVTVTFENRTSEAVWIYQDGRLLDSVPAGESWKANYGEHSWHEHLTALDENKDLVWSADISWEKLKEIGYVVIIESPSPTPEPTTGAPSGGGSSG